MFRNFIALLLVTLFLVQSFTRTFIYLNYQANKDYISNVLCENKAKKEMHCEGKCHLKKELQEEEKKESTPTGSSKQKFETQLFNSIDFQELVFTSTISYSRFFYTSSHSEEHLTPVFQPPALA